jgi:P27 family predicted phage terminase small subunit
MKGRKPKPPEVHELNGNPSKIKNLAARKAAAPKPDVSVPSCPTWLDGIARTEWRRVCPELSKIGLLTQVDRTALAGYCAAYSRWVRAEIAIQEKFELINNVSTRTNGLTQKVGRRGHIKMPEVDIAKDALNQVRQFCAEFGLTPSARARMTIPGKPEQDELDKLLSKGINN